jgi:Fe2+ or Zn2+ uptake regulation protein
MEKTADSMILGGRKEVWAITGTEETR